MQTFLSVIGALYVTAFTAGGLGLIDFHVCIAKAGACNCTIKPGAQHEN